MLGIIGSDSITQQEHSTAKQHALLYMIEYYRSKWDTRARARIGFVSGILLLHQLLSYTAAARLDCYFLGTFSREREKI